MDTVDIDILPHVHVVDADPEGFRQIITTGACFIPPNRQQAMLRLGFCLGRIVMLGCGYGVRGGEKGAIGAINELLCGGRIRLLRQSQCRDKRDDDQVQDFKI